MTATFESIDCRLVALEADVAGATDLGSLQALLQDQVAGARERFEQIPGADSQRKKRTLAKGAIRKIIAFAHRVRSNKGRKVIPESTRGRLTSQADPLRKHMVAYRLLL